MCRTIMSCNAICRICLQDGALYPIFQKEENEQDTRSKMSICLQVSIEDIVGYPRQICNSCRETLDVLYIFINKFKETCKILEKGLLNIKEEKDTYIDYDCSGQLNDEFNICNIKEESTAKSQPDYNEQSNLNISREKRDKKIMIEKENIKSKTFSTIIKYSSKKPVSIASSKLDEQVCFTGKKLRIKSNDIILSEQQTVTKRIRKIKEHKSKLPPPPKLCDLCGEVFKDQEKLSTHKKKIHFKNPVKCPKCPRFCVSDYYLKRHIKRKHETEKQFTCATCNRAFAFRGELTSHYKNVHNKNLKPKKVFACKICNKTYKCPKSVIVHERSVHTGDRPAVCTVCGTSFFHDDYLKEHMRLHTGETPFKCPICGRGYAQRCNMKSHLRIHRISELDDNTLSKLKPNYIKLLKA